MRASVRACLSHQQAVEEDVDKHSQAADDEVKEVVEELKVHHHGLVATCEGSAIPHKADQEDDFVTYLKNEWMNEWKKGFIIILHAQNQQGLGWGLWEQWDV